MARFNVLMTDSIFADLALEAEELAAIGAEIRLAGGTTPEILAREGSACDAAINVYAKLTAEVLSAWRACKVIVRTGVGTDTIDLPAATAARIMVANVPDYCLDEVADHTMALFLSCVRKVALLTRRVRGGEWKIDPAKPIPRLQGRVFGLLGFGNIARRVARRAQAFELEVMAFDPYVPADAFAAAGVKRAAALEEVLAAADFLSLHLPLSAETSGLLNADRIRRMKPTAFVFNTSRGPLIDGEALLAALREGRLAGAGLDVLPQEPPSFPCALAELDTVVVTPHAAFYSEAAMPELRRRSAREVARTLTEGRPMHWVNRTGFPG